MKFSTALALVVSVNILTGQQWLETLRLKSEGISLVLRACASGDNYIYAFSTENTATKKHSIPVTAIPPEGCIELNVYWRGRSSPRGSTPTSFSARIASPP